MTIFSKYKKGYKLVRDLTSDETIFLSAFSDGHDVYYKVKEWVERPDECGPLAVFKNLKSLKNFMYNRNDNKWVDRSVFKCKYEKSTEETLYCMKNSTYLDSYLRRATMPGIPEGTMFAEKVMLLKKVL